jgi:hypothetical protein
MIKTKLPENRRWHKRFCSAADPCQEAQRITDTALKRLQIFEQFFLSSLDSSVPHAPLIAVSFFCRVKTKTSLLQSFYAFSTTAK